jgi:hypothetical protein
MVVGTKAGFVRSTGAATATVTFDDETNETAMLTGQAAAQGLRIRLNNHA